MDFDDVLDLYIEDFKTAYKLRKLPADLKTSCIHGLAGKALWKWPSYLQQPTDLVQSQLRYQNYSIHTYKVQYQTLFKYKQITKTINK